MDGSYSPNTQAKIDESFNKLVNIVEDYVSKQPPTLPPGDTEIEKILKEVTTEDLISPLRRTPDTQKHILAKKWIFNSRITNIKEKIGQKSEHKNFDQNTTHP